MNRWEDVWFGNRIFAGLKAQSTWKSGQSLKTSDCLLNLLLHFTTLPSPEPSSTWPPADTCFIIHGTYLITSITSKNLEGLEEPHKLKVKETCMNWLKCIWSKQNIRYSRSGDRLSVSGIRSMDGYRYWPSALPVRRQFHAMSAILYLKVCLRFETIRAISYIPFKLSSSLLAVGEAARR